MKKEWVPWLIVLALVAAWWWWTQKQKKAAAAAAPSRPPNLVVVEGGVTMPSNTPGVPGWVEATNNTAQQLSLKGYTVTQNDTGQSMVQAGKPYTTQGV